MFHRSERLLLRPPWPEDWQDVHHALADEGVVRNLARAPWPYTHENAQDFCNAAFDPCAPRFLVTLAANAQLIGCIGIDPSGEDGEAELGYWIARDHWGRGYATEAARAALDIAETIGVASIGAGHFVDNPASGRVLRKVGFLPTGRVEPRHSAGRGETAPCVLYRRDLHALGAAGTCAGPKAA